MRGWGGGVRCVPVCSGTGIIGQLLLLPKPTQPRTSLPAQPDQAWNEIFCNPTKHPTSGLLCLIGEQPDDRLREEVHRPQEAPWASGLLDSGAICGLLEMGGGEKQGDVGEERVKREQHHPFTLFQGLTKLQGGGGGEVLLVGEEGEQVGCHALLLAAASHLLRSILPQTPDQDEVLVILPAKHRVITTLVNNLYGCRDRGEKAEILETEELATLLGINQELSKSQFFGDAHLPEPEPGPDKNEKSNLNAKEGEAREWISSECEHCGKSFPNGKKLKQHETRCGTEHKYVFIFKLIFFAQSKNNIFLIQVSLVWRPTSFRRQPCSAHEKPHRREAICL